MRPNAFVSLEEARFANLFTSKREFHFICGLEEVNYVRRVSKLFLTRLNRFADAITTGLGRLCHFVLVCFGAGEAVSSERSLVIIISAPSCLCRCCYYLAHVDGIHSN